VTGLLPPEFVDLEPFVAAWALPTEKQRQAKRVGNDLDSVGQFYDAMLPRMAALFDYLDKIPHGNVAQLPENVLRLYRLGAAFIEASHPIEMKWRRTDIDDAFPLDRMNFLPPSDQR
jgi:hypothetical protein